MDNVNYVHVVPDSQLYTHIDQLIETMRCLKFKLGNSILLEDEIDYILVGLQNSKKDGYNLVKG